MIRFSKNKKTNAVYNGVFNQLLEIHDTTGESIEEVKHYYKEFRNVSPDFNIAQYGNVLCYYSDIYKFYADCDFKAAAAWSTEKLWLNYRILVGFVARYIVLHEEEILEQNGGD